MIDPNAIAGIAHEQYKRWDSARDTIGIKHLEGRAKDRELQKARGVSKGVSVKAAAPAKEAIKGGAGVDKLVAGNPGAWSRDSMHKKQGTHADRPWNPNEKGNNQPSLTRNAPGNFGTGKFEPSRNLTNKADYTKAPEGMGRYSFPKPSTPSAPAHPPFNSANKGFGQPNLNRNAPGGFNHASPPSAPSAGGWAARTGNALVNKANAIGAQRASNKATPAAGSSGPGWLNRTGNALQARADEIGTERAVRSRSFSSGATSHSTGHGNRAF